MEGNKEPGRSSS